MSVPTIIGMACMNPGFRKELFAVQAGEKAKRQRMMKKLLSNYGLAADEYTVERLVKFVRPLDARTLTGESKIAAKRLIEGRRIAGKVHEKLKAKLKDTLESKDVAEAMVKGILDLDSPGSLEGACEMWWALSCPIWPCDPLEP